MKDVIRESLGRILADICTAETVRQVEATRDAGILWSGLEATGFLDALVPEDAGGSGLSLADILPVPDLCGRHAVPAPFTETIFARAILVDAGIAAPAGGIALATGRKLESGEVQSSHVPLGRVADYVLVDCDGLALLLPAGSATLNDARFVLDAAMCWPAEAVAKSPSASLDEPIRTIQAFIYSAQLGGAFTAVFERTIEYANQRQQFGKPIGKFQAIQHQLALMAEQVFSARMAIELTACTASSGLDPHRIAVAKARTSEAAVEVSALGHSIHGAIGFTEEYDLQLHTRRINAWRATAGSESYWFAKLGALLMEDDRPMAVDVLRELTAA